MFSRYLLALALTLVLGPGAGHLVLRQYRKAVILILLALAVVFAMAAYVASAINPADLPQNFNAMAGFLKNFMAKNADKIKVFNIPLAVLWSYAFADIIWSGMILYNKEKKRK